MVTQNFSEMQGGWLTDKNSVVAHMQPPRPFGGMECPRTRTITMAQSLQLNHRSKIANFFQDSIHFPYFWKPLRGPTAGRATPVTRIHPPPPPLPRFPPETQREISRWFRNTKSEPTWGKENTHKGENPAGMFYFGLTGTERLSIFIYRGRIPMDLLCALPRAASEGKVLWEYNLAKW